MLMHNLIRVTEKYNDTAKVLKEVDPLMDKKKKNLNSLMTMAETLFPLLMYLRIMVPLWKTPFGMARICGMAMVDLHLKN